MDNALTKWLNSDEGAQALLLCAVQISNRAKRLDLVLEDSYLEVGSQNDFYQAIASGLAVFLLDPDRAERVALKAETLLGADPDRLMTLLCSEYLDYCIDRRRENNPFHEYYRRMRTVLSTAEGVRCQALQRKGTYFAFSDSADLHISPSTVAFPDYAEWPGCDAVPFSEIYATPAMLRLSRHYWDEALLTFLQEYLFPIREVVRFVATKYPLRFTINTTGPREGDGEDNEAHSEKLLHTVPEAWLEDAWKRQLPMIGLDLIDREMDPLARDCVASMTAAERVILSRRDDGVSLQDIADELKMKAPGNVSYHLGKAYNKIRTKWALWGPPDADFADQEEENYLFYEKVISFCREAIDAVKG